jgi:electron transport complex protein RnfG
MKVPRLFGPAAVLLAALDLVSVCVPAPALASEYWTATSLLGDFFKGSAHIGPRSFTLSDAAAAEIGKKLGADLKKKTWNVYVAEDADHKRTGYALLDQEIGLHENIDYGVRFGLGGAVERVEIMVYREPYGDEVRGERFRKQFVGKTGNDALTAGKDIDIISGASYSSRALALGVKRDALVLQAALKSGL